MEENILTKICTKCNLEQARNNFNKKKTGKYGLASWCKTCNQKYKKQYNEDNAAKYKQYYEDNKENILNKSKEYYKKNKEFVLNKNKKYALNNLEKIKEKNKEYYKNNKEKIQQYKLKYNKDNEQELKDFHKEYYEKNKEKIKKRNKEYYEKNKEKIILKRKIYREINKTTLNIKRRKYWKERVKNDLNFKIRNLLAHRISAAVKAQSTKKISKSVDLLGCTPQKAAEYLESKFQKGMSWDNYGNWHIDHIIPCASFDLTKEEEQRKCFHYTNLQPLWAEDNLKKSNKI